VLKNLQFPYSENRNISVQIFEQAEQLDALWERFAQQDLFLQKPFLYHIEKNLKNELKPVYVKLFENDIPVGIVYAQIITFNSTFFNENTNENFLKKLQKNGIYCLLDFTQVKLLVIGNIYLTGQHGFSIASEFDTNIILDNVVKIICKQFKTKASIIKDIEPNALQIKGYSNIEVQPNMIFFNPNWSSFDDYLMALNSKHRVKAKKILGLGKELHLERLNHMNHEISETLYQLYLKMIANANYNLSKINRQYLHDLFYMENAHIYTIQLHGKIEAFFAYFNNGKYATAHYLGYNTELKNNVALYHNILFFLIQCTIHDKFEKMIWARTALEIKSSVGAKPETTSIIIRHENKYINACIAKGLQLFKQENWVERHPFK